MFVGNATYRIEWLTPDEWQQGRHDDTADGITYCTVTTIVVRLHAGAPESHYQEVVWHEICHAIWDTTMLTHYHSNPDEGDREEFIIGATTPAQVFVIKQNPALMAWLLDDGTVVR